MCDSSSGRVELVEAQKGLWRERTTDDERRFVSKACASESETVYLTVSEVQEVVFEAETGGVSVVHDGDGDWC